MVAVAKNLDSHVIDEVGSRHGRLTVLEYAGENNRHTQWLCRCDCGAEKIIYGHHLRYGAVKSCGCSRSLPKGEAAFNQLFRGIKYSAVRRKKKFKLTKEQVRDLVTRPCRYCGALPAQRSRSLRCNGDFLYNGIDRVDNSLGYVEGNVVPCCGQCNNAKRTIGAEEFKAWIVQVYEHSIGGQRE